MGSLLEGRVWSVLALLRRKMIRNRLAVVVVSSLVELFQVLSIVDDKKEQGKEMRDKEPAVVKKSSAVV